MGNTTTPITINSTLEPAPAGQMRTFTVVGSLVLSLALSENVTGQDLLENKEFVSSLAGSLANGLEVEPSTVNVTTVALVATESTPSPRRLASDKQLSVGYILTVEDERTANQLVMQLQNETTKAAFETAFVADLEKRVAASGIAGVQVKGVLVGPVTKESKIVPVPNTTMTTTRDFYEGFEAFKAGKEMAIGNTDGDGTNWGAVVGGLIGAGVGSFVVCYFYVWHRKKNQQE